MTIQDWGAIGEIVNAIAVLATLLYLAIQIKQNSSTTRAQTHQQLASDRAYSLRMMVENQELRDTTKKATRGEGLTENEQGILFWFTTLNVRAYENELYQHSMGMIDSEELEVQRKLLGLPHMQIEAVAMSLDTFTPAAQAEIRKLAEGRQRAT